MVGTIICEVGTIICDIGTIKLKFYLLEARYLFFIYFFAEIIEHSLVHSNPIVFYCVFSLWGDSQTV
jgi:hypothetical protein